MFRLSGRKRVHSKGLQVRTLLQQVWGASSKATCFNEVQRPSQGERRHEETKTGLTTTSAWGRSKGGVFGHEGGDGKQL